MHVRILCGLLVLAAAACGEPRTPPSPQPQPPGGGETITGRERLGWIQPAASTAELATFDYAIYVDDVRRAFTGETCAGTAGPNGFECSAPLPPLTSGRHSLAMASFITSGGATLESSRSSPLVVTVVAATRPADGSSRLTSTFETAGGLVLESGILADGLDDPSDIAVTPDGRLFVAERGGRILAIAGDDLREAIRLDVRQDDEGEDGLMSLALDRDFERTHAVFAAMHRGDASAPVITVARYTERNDTFGQAAVVAQFAPATRGTTAVVRIGPDKKLFLALGATGDPRDAQTAASPFGKIHRLNTDGTAPSDAAGRPPVVSIGHRDPRALAWHPVTGALWETERDETGDELNAVVRGGNFGWPLVRGRGLQPGMTPAVLQMPAHTDVSAAAFAPAGTFAGAAADLLIAGSTIQELFRIRFTPAGRPAAVEALLNGRFGKLGAIAVGPDGSIYVTTANRETWGKGRDQLLRIRAVS
jgi:glucose/arabinose dehydrogenase